MSATELKTEVRTQAIGRISRGPELSRTSEGVPVCRFGGGNGVGAGKQPGRQHRLRERGRERRYSNKLAVRVSHLGVGDLVIVPGIERQRRRKVRGVGFTESAIEATEVRLRERQRGARAWRSRSRGGAKMGPMRKPTVFAPLLICLALLLGCVGGASGRDPNDRVLPPSRDDRLRRRRRYPARPPLRVTSSTCAWSASTPPRT